MHLKLLLIEDNEIYTRFVRAITEEAFAQIHHASTLEDGFREMQQHTFDAIVLDLGLPDSKRNDTVKNIPHIKSLQPQAVLLVASMFSEYKEPSLEAGADVFMDKKSTSKHNAMVTAILAMMSNKKATPEQTSRLLQNVAEA